MKTFAEIRRSAREAMRKGWSGRLLLIIVTMQLCVMVVDSVFGEISRSCNAVSFLAYADKVLTHPLSAEEFLRMLWASCFEAVPLVVLSGITLLALASATLRAQRGDGVDWFKQSFVGFRCPLRVAGMAFVQNLVVAFCALVLFMPVFIWLWARTGRSWLSFLLALPFSLPGLVAAYRYRAAWYLCDENPAWGAIRCLKESAKLMCGWKFRAFLFDLSYFGWMVLVAFAMVLASILALVPTLVPLAVLMAFALLAFAFFVLIYFILGRAGFYLEMKKQLKSEHAAS